MDETWGAPASAQPAEDVLGAPARRGRGVRGALLGTAAAVVVAGVAGTAWAAASFLSGGGEQPEDVLPAGTVAMAKIDLDPAASQKLAVYRLAQRFPTTSDDVSGADDVRDELLRALFEDNAEIDYARDLEPWVGDRAAIAAVPVAGGLPQPLAAVAYTDRAEAEAALSRLAAGSPDSFFAFSDNADFVLLGTSQETVDAAAGASEVLADAPRFADDVDALDGDQVVTAWADLDAVWQAVPDELREQALASQQLQPTGRLVVGGRATSDGVEVLGRTFGLSTGNAQGALLGSGAGSGMVGDLPEDTIAAAGVTGLGEALVGVYDDLVAAGDPFSVAETAEIAGLDLPGDLRVVFGEELVVGAFGPEDVAARSRTDDPGRALQVVETLVATVFGFGQEFEQEVYVEQPFEGEGFAGQPFPAEPPGETFPAEPPPGEPFPAPYPGEAPPEGELAQPGVAFGSVGRGLSELPAEQLRRLDDGIAVGSSALAVDRITSDDGGLGRSAVFQRAVPDHQDAGLVLFVDVARAVEASGAPADSGDLDALEAVGLTATGGGDGTFRLRVTVR